MAGITKPLRSKEFILCLRRCTAVFVGLVVMATCPMANAGDKKETWYQIEIIVAKRTDTKPLDEIFPFQPAPLTWHRGRTLTEFDAETENSSDLDYKQFIKLPTNQHLLNNEARQLTSSGAYVVLEHKGWRQILAGDKTINWVDIKGGYAWGGHQQLEGSLGFSKGRFLHVHSDLHYNQFPSVASLSSQQAKQALLSAGQSLVPIVETRYSLLQRRKMRSNELHYLDHPELVLLVKIIPYTPAEPILEAIDADEPILLDLTVPSNAE